jgi:3-mercaptopyruvate sulfurtransferase SseA
MRLKFIYSVMILAVAIAFTSCNSTDNTAVNPKPASTPGIDYPDGARRVTTEELDTLIKKGEAFLVDVRNQDSYDLGHIPGSRLIPAGEILDHVNELPRDKIIITYCS